MIIRADCLTHLQTIQKDTFDSLVCDPPAGINFMGKAWDSNKGGRDGWIEWMTEVSKECLRVLKPGAHGLVWAIPRTSHWTAFALEKAGFEIRDIVTHIFGSGFPKSLDISKAIDKMAGDIPATPETRIWQGFGTALKPASEHWILVRKPLGEKTVAKNVLKHGTGGLNIDVSRVDSMPRTPGYKNPGTIYETSGEWNARYSGVRREVDQTQGRFPANLILSHHTDCVEVGVKEVKASGGDIKAPTTSSRFKNTHQQTGSQPEWKAYGKDGKETVADWQCHDECAVRELDRQSGERKSAGTYKKSQSDGRIDNASKFGLGNNIRDNSYAGDTGGASRFFYCAKASKRDRGSDNKHPTVKSTKLMSYLIKLVTPPNGVVLDPFMGSGSTGVAAIKEGFDFYGIEQEAEYFEIAKRRINHVETIRS